MLKCRIYLAVHLSRHKSVMIFILKRGGLAWFVVLLSCWPPGFKSWWGLDSGHTNERGRDYQL